MKKIHIILILFPIYINAQNSIVSEFIISDSLKNDISYQKNLGIEKEILRKISNQEINLYSLEQKADNCSEFRLIKKKEDIQIIKKRNESEKAEIFSTDYLMVYNDSSDLKIHQALDGFSDSVRVMANGESVYIVNGRGHLERVFTLNDIENIYFLYETSTTKLIAFSFKLRLNFIGLHNVWFKLDDFLVKSKLDDFMILLKKISEDKKVLPIEKIKFCEL
jgi:hypothetical protein